MVQQDEFAESLIRQLAQRSVTGKAVQHASIHAPPASRPRLITISNQKSLDIARSRQIQVTVKELKSNNPPLELTLSCLTSIDELKHQVAVASSIPAESQRLVLSGKALTNTRTLLDYGVKKQVTIHLSRKPDGPTTAISSNESNFTSTVPIKKADEEPISTDNHANTIQSVSMADRISNLAKNDEIWTRIGVMIEKELESPEYTAKVVSHLKQTLQSMT
ncbi:hypothetical protein QVD99_006563 [Batrachochytrium dendrobatidis]|nr:hypothetical protein QVD99_006563 [Batrachochytrium dendrobatidis]